MVCHWAAVRRNVPKMSRSAAISSRVPSGMGDIETQRRLISRWTVGGFRRSTSIHPDTAAFRSAGPSARRQGDALSLL